jgi:hypothetical protein
VNRRKTFVAASLLAACTLAVCAHAEVTAAERKKITELMDILGAENISRQAGPMLAGRLSYALKQADPQIDEKAFRVVSEITSEVLAARSPDLREKMIGLYDTHFTEAEIDELLAYYRSPIGRKFLDTMPTLMKESMDLAVTDATVAEIQKKVNEKLRADGLLKDK